MYFKWADGHTKILDVKYKPRGLQHKGKRPISVAITFTEVKQMFHSTRTTEEFMSKIRAIEYSLVPPNKGQLIPVYL